MHFQDLESIQDKKEVTLHGCLSTVLIDGLGDIPCLTVGIGSLLQRTLSKNIKQKLRIYSTDLYWANQETDIDLDELTIETICRDIIDIANQLNLSNYYLMGHSVFGGLAVEIAKYQPPGLLGVIGIGATPGWNNTIINYKNQYFQDHASTKRKKHFSDLQAEFNQAKQATDSLLSVNAYYAESPKYFANPVTIEDIQQLWSGIDCDDRLANHLFNVLLAKYDFENNIDSVKVPVIIAGGQKDYDSVPLELWKPYSNLKNFTLYDCGAVGHWPHMENTMHFDVGVLRWIKTKHN